MAKSSEALTAELAALVAVLPTSVLREREAELRQLGDNDGADAAAAEIASREKQLADRDAKVAEEHAAAKAAAIKKNLAKLADASAKYHDLVQSGLAHLVAYANEEAEMQQAYAEANSAFMMLLAVNDGAIDPSFPEPPKDIRWHATNGEHAELLKSRGII